MILHPRHTSTVNGSPGTSDYVSISLSNGYVAGGTLTSGDIKSTRPDLDGQRHADQGRDRDSSRERGRRANGSSLRIASVDRANAPTHGGGNATVPCSPDPALDSKAGKRMQRRSDSPPAICVHIGTNARRGDARGTDDYRCPEG